MTWFVDASVIVAIVGRELGWETLADKMDEEARRLWSPVVRWESVVAARLRLNSSVDVAIQRVNDVARVNALVLVPIDAAEAEAAVDAMRRYGKPSGHRAQLNMGDCFAYACARTNDARLLYKGNDFSHTDMAL